MNEKGEKTCPLCAEEMDLTDQHLKPCKCGYQICVWCWHQIIEMAEKDKTEGRCPACRTPYDKEKIVGMTVSCESLVAELNNDRKKSQKVKPKPSEARKDLTGVRVIQRNLVYVMGLHIDLANEDLFQRMEYFGQYGKILKVAMSRTASGAVQQYPNDTCSVYITYSKEEEAIRCIQSVHGFVLDGRPLKACFGTMKYCHAWLRNMPCTNLDCLYLHEIGSQEDSFTKDETISAHMRKMVQQITGAVDYFQRRSGSMLPPPVDNNSSTTKIPKIVSNNAHSVVKSSPSNGHNGQSVTLPPGALWGVHSSTHIVQNTPCSREPLRDKAVPISSHSDVLKKPALEDNHSVDGNALKPQSLLDDQTDFPELSLSNKTQISNSRALVSASMDNSRAVSVPSECTSQSCRFMPANGNKMINRSDDVVLKSTDSVVDGFLRMTASESSHLDHASIRSSQTEVHPDSLQRCVNESREMQPLHKSGVGTALMVTDRYLEAEDDISLFNRQRLNDPEVVSCQPKTQYKPEQDETRTVFGTSLSDSRGSNIEVSHSEPSQLNDSLNHSTSMFSDKARGGTQPSGKCAVDSHGNSRSEIDDSAIANLLSLDLDEYLTSPQNLAELLGVANSSNQSRFFFAREEEPKDRSFDSYNNVFNQHSSERKSPDMEMRRMYNGLQGLDYVMPSSYKPPSVPRCSVPAPPGFSASNRLPPNGREQQTLNGFAGTHRVSDVQSMDPAILAVGRGIENANLGFRSNFKGNTNMFGKQVVKQSTLYSQQNCRFSDTLGGMGSARLIDGTQRSNIQAMPSGGGQWSSNEIQSRNRLVQDERLVASTNMMSAYNGTFRI